MKQSDIFFSQGKKKEKAAPPKFDLQSILFAEQLAFVRDPAKFATAVCSVRAGKTVSCAADLIHTALTLPGTTGLYITLARATAKRIVWPELVSLNHTYNLKGKLNLVDLTVTFPNKSIIYCGGASTEQEIEKYRGLGNVAVAYIDESQAFRAHIKELVEDVLIKRLYDLNGRLRLIGTPGPVQAGYFYDASHNPSWSHHGWTLHQNPHITRKSGLTVQELIEQDCRQRGVTVDHASIQRECFGRWEKDDGSLMLNYDAAKNDFNEFPAGGKPSYLLGLDIGFIDSDAVVVLGWNDNGPETYLVEELITPRQTTDQLAQQIQYLANKYPLSKMVCDAGGGGKKAVEDLKARYGLSLEAADKLGKISNYNTLNNSLRNGTFKARRDSTFAGDCNLLEIDRDKSLPDKTVVKGHSDAVDAVLYAFKFSPAYAWAPPKKETRPGEPNYWKEQEAKLEEHMMGKLRQEADQREGKTNYGDWQVDSKGIPPWHKW